MKRVLAILVAVLFWQESYAEELRELLQAAANATGTNYTALRNQIIGHGQQVVPELQQALVDIGRDWKERAMAGIALEWIQRGDVIRGFVNYEWHKDPILKDDPGWLTRSGMPRRFGDAFEKQVAEVNLNYYYLEVAWKEISERPQIGSSWIMSGAGMAEKCENPYLLHVAREKVENIGVKWNGVPAIDGNWYYSYLLRTRDHESLPMLVDLWTKYRETYRPKSLRYHKDGNPHRMEEDIERFADNTVDGHLQLLLTVATPADEEWILEKLKGIKLGPDGRRFLADYQRRCREPVASAAAPSSAVSAPVAPPPVTNPPISPVASVRQPTGSPGPGSWRNARFVLLAAGILLAVGLGYVLYRRNG